MGARYREVGGGSAVGLADDWINQLQSLMRGGSTPGTQMTRAGGVNSQAGGIEGLVNSPANGGGIMGTLQDLLSQGGGRVGGALSSSMNRSINQQRQQLQSQFANIGGGYGSGAAQATSRFNSQMADQVPMDIFNMQMSAINPLMSYINQMAGRGIAQRQGYMAANPWLNAVQAASGLIGAVGTLKGGHYSAPNINSGQTINTNGDMQGGDNIFQMPALPQAPMPWNSNPTGQNQNNGEYQLPQLPPWMRRG